ncbi:MAG: SDR family NAD(P)-dependent oxidoreductase [Nanoarchaeota archaeon]|nr:NAD-dependent epimerase/dehydratase family protein [Nanoarchaeota archaeon]MBU1444872.1 NAD-dependent epimerase/dehydratase family protein [Nanoarchaeota archaeon]MBU2420930.1 NAD-dependent epimerase/dehydratase family protein [Nanoarchaeota archaeon]MBU2475149.1 NAD-dependent epimerase/dehydratase family protein [Nanoarchaeota archaeon]
MHALVTGATGFIGFPLTNELVKKGHKVRCLVRNASNLKELKKLDVELVFGDIEKKETLKSAVKNIDTVYHLAGGGNVTATFKKGYQKLKKLNVDAVENLLEECIKAKVKNFILFSSISAMGIIIEKKLDEETKPEPLTPHEICKYESELLIEKYKNKINFTILRPGIVYGPRGINSEILLLCKLIKKGILPIPGNGDNLMPFIYVNDLVKATLLISENKSTRYETYIIVSENEPTFNQIAKTIKKYLNPKAKLLHVPRKMVIFSSSFMEKIGNLFDFEPMFNQRRAISMTSNRIYDTSKLKRLIKSQQTELNEGLKESIEWYKEKKLI